MIDYDKGVQFGDEALGTCLSEISVFERLEMDEGLMNSESFCSGLDNTAMLCEQCGWWCEPCDLSYANRCTDCAEPEDEE